MDKAHTTKDFGWKRRDLRTTRQKPNGSLKLKHTGGHTVDEKSSGTDCLIPKVSRDIHGKHEGAGDLSKVTIFAFSHSILLWSVNASRLKKDTTVIKICPKTSIYVLSPIITTEDFNFSIKLSAHHLVKRSKAPKNFIFRLE
jgi:hypothetical protein